MSKARLIAILTNPATADHLTPAMAQEVASQLGLVTHREVGLNHLSGAMAAMRKQFDALVGHDAGTGAGVQLTARSLQHRDQISTALRDCVPPESQKLQMTRRFRSCGR